MNTTKIIVAITGASGVIYGIRLLQILNDLKKSFNNETHLIISKAAHITIKQETSYSINDIKALATYYYNVLDISATIASGSNHIDAMIISPCSMKTLSAVAHGYENNLISRAAAVTLKEKRRLVLMIRETPLNSIQIKNMLELSNIGALICPPIPAFYNKPNCIDDMINHSVARVLTLVNIKTQLIKPWNKS
ncbi:UbiX family flavin prenyltransferase [Rickettsia endosymbiont of Cardiosporidium cionae]|uniref:UbiX family flavin prenyltransferase n=1 Tax=Rickettsia endosymbiont of Cardiosporidium cionae TaxID=2777155 RepID=UPI0018962155|nr:UbiX family flavin prenyltransferase [Rickettsia endosymbiont of Cardiosporidium cionae]KAF8818506.1 UbiX family flavin prenyltransferase [Rickettsia endosymbiont of Cardiosporidium cionae]